MKESDLTAPITDLLSGWGYTVYSEVPALYRVIDLVGRRGRDLVIVELKLSLTSAVLGQLRCMDLITSNIYAAVSTMPTKKSIERFTKLGMGVITTKDAHVRVLERPRPRDTLYRAQLPHYIKRMHAMLDHMEPGGIAGQPNLKGTGPAQECAKRVKAYRAKNPGSTWRDIFANVDNHYSSFRSMSGALTSRGLV